jgi:hypothetical protein
VQPAAEPVPVADARGGPDEGEEGGLEGVLGVGVGREHVPADVPDERPVPADEPGERGRVAGPGEPGEQVAVRLAVGGGEGGGVVEDGAEVSAGHAAAPGGGVPHSSAARPVPTRKIR